MKRLVECEGVPSAMISTEERARSTYENAAFSAKILQARGIRRIVLVTNAYHMLRAERCFRKQGIEVIPAPCEFLEIDTLLPGWDALRINERTLHELVALIWYCIKGRI
jgi:uncharacterized SAM-binding protein YcdF (DUF218 family)